PNFHALLLSYSPLPTLTHALSLHDALPISLPPILAHGLQHREAARSCHLSHWSQQAHIDQGTHTLENVDLQLLLGTDDEELEIEDRKSTRLNSSHSQISYAVFCLKKKKNYQ